MIYQGLWYFGNDYYVITITTMTTISIYSNIFPFEQYNISINTSKYFPNLLFTQKLLFGLRSKSGKFKNNFLALYIRTGSLMCKQKKKRGVIKYEYF